MQNQYATDAIVNDLEFNRHQEELAIDGFATYVHPGHDVCRQTPVAQSIPNWTRVSNLS